MKALALSPAQRALALASKRVFQQGPYSICIGDADHAQ